jgi:hypothetical protein
MSKTSTESKGRLWAKVAAANLFAAGILFGLASYLIYVDIRFLSRTVEGELLSFVLAIARLPLIPVAFWLANRRLLRFRQWGPAEHTALVVFISLLFGFLASYPLILVHIALGGQL